MHSTLNVQEVFVPRVALPLLPHENPPFPFPFPNLFLLILFLKAIPSGDLVIVAINKFI